MYTQFSIIYEMLIEFKATFPAIETKTPEKK